MPLANWDGRCGRVERAEGTDLLGIFAHGVGEAGATYIILGMLSGARF